MPNSSIEVVVQTEDNSRSSKVCKRERIQARRVTGVVPTTEPPMIKFDDLKRITKSSVCVMSVE